MKGRTTEISSSIATKQVEYEETKKQYEAIVEANQKFYDYASKFRDMYVKIQTLEEKKERLKSDLDDTKLNLQEVVGGFDTSLPSLDFSTFRIGTDEELQSRLTRFDDHINTRKQKRRQEDTRKQDIEDNLANVRERHTELVDQRGGLVAEAEVSFRKIILSR